MNRSLAIFDNAELSLSRFDHAPGGEHIDPRAEEADRYYIALVESGTFRLDFQREEERLQKGSLLLAVPGFSYRCTHDDAFPTDSCLVLTARTPHLDTRQRSRLERILRRRHVSRASSATAYLFHAASRATTLGVEAGLFALAQQLFDTAEDLGPGVSAARLRACAPRLDLARQIMETELSEPLSISQIAARVSLSPWHFSRLFTEFTGESPHRFLTRLRLFAAARMLREGTSVTEACFDAGFTHPSHFARSFRRAFGVLPSSFCRARSTARKC